MEFNFSLDLKIDSKLSTNKIYAGCHYSVRKRDKDMIFFLVRSQVKSPPKFTGPVELVFSWNSKLDLSNHSYISKMLEDGLVSLEVLPGDTKKFVQRITHEIAAEKKAPPVSVKIRNFVRD